MPETGEDADYAERAAAKSEVTKDAWEATIEDMFEMEEELEEQGWDVMAVAAGHTAPESPRAEPAGRFGLTYTIPDNFADEFREAFREDGFERYEVYRGEQEGTAFQVTALYDEETSTAILLAGAYELRHANPLVATAMKAGHMYSHVRLLDGTHLGSFRHEGYELFFPDADRRMNEVTEEMEKAMGLVDGEADPETVRQMSSQEPEPNVNARLGIDADPSPPEVEAGRAAAEARESEDDEGDVEDENA
ncbi:hypothetical protein ACFQE8_05265 [Salinirubellus sp. GCM10025818]|uniref:DUF7529 family protein n=1 Tax=Salinirubellus TaxID=2162630 RepID=UPI0030CE4D46